MESIGILGGSPRSITHTNIHRQILKESIPEDDDLMRESAGQVLKAADRAAELTRSLLAFSRKQVMNPKPIQIDTLISDTSKLMRRIIGEDIEFSTTFSNKKLFIMADAGQIEQVLMNLATNARDAMPHGGRLTISTQEVVVKQGSEALYDLAAPGKYAMISVATGAWDYKKQWKGSLTFMHQGGDGLGLSIVHGIIKQHEGSAMVSSTPGKGTTFKIFLPLIKGHEQMDQSPISPSLAGGMETILVAEDEEVVRAFLRKILERNGYKVIEAGDGEEALARFKEHTDISLVLSDVVMPKMNGKEILEEIRKLKTGIKVIFISGYNADIIQIKGIAEEGVEYITKPFNKNDLLQKIRDVLDKE
jgi:CheY-like chemotaxis protein